MQQTLILKLDKGHNFERLHNLWQTEPERDHSFLATAEVNVRSYTYISLYVFTT